MEEAPNVYRLTVGEGEFAGVYAPNVYLVVGDDAAVFIDTANGTEEEVRAHLGLWDGMDRPRIAAIVLTVTWTTSVGLPTCRVTPEANSTPARAKDNPSSMP